MFSISCCSKVSFSSDDSDFSYILGYKAIEAEIATQHSEMEDREDDMDGPYTNKPLAGEEWTREYRRRMVEKKKRDRMLKSRLKGLTSHAFLPTLVTMSSSWTPSAGLGSRILHQ